MTSPCQPSVTTKGRRKTGDKRSSLGALDTQGTGGRGGGGEGGGRGQGRERNSGAASHSSGRRPGKIHTGARGAESGGGRAVERGCDSLFGVHGGENDNWSPWQRPSPPRHHSTRPYSSTPTLLRPLLPPPPPLPTLRPKPSLSLSLFFRGALSFFGEGEEGPRTNGAREIAFSSF